MRDDADTRLGEIFRRLALLRSELGENSYDRTVRDLLQALGASALREAEHRARTLDESGRPRPTDVRVTPFPARRPREPMEDDP